MASDEGMFGGYRFSDLFLPAAAAVASAYNPYIGKGINTGLMMFNTFADVQQQAKYWKHLKSEREREDRLVSEAQAAMDPLISQLQEWQQGRRGELEQGIRDEDIVRFSQAQGGMPDAISPEIFERGIAGPPDLQPRLAESAETDDYLKALRLNELQQQAYRAGMPLSPGSAISGAGILSQQLEGSLLERDRMMQINKDLQERDLAQFTRKNLLMDKRFAKEEEAALLRAKLKEENLKVYEGIANSISETAASLKGAKKMDDDELAMRIASSTEALARIAPYAADPAFAASAEAAKHSIAVLSAEQKRRETERKNNGGGKEPSAGGAVYRFNPDTGTTEYVGAASH